MLVLTQAADCKYAHGVEDFNAEGIVSPAFYKTRFCVYFDAKSTCVRGALCRFAHGEGELRSMASSNAHAMPMALNEPMKVITQQSLHLNEPMKIDVRLFSTRFSSGSIGSSVSS